MEAKFNTNRNSWDNPTQTISNISNSNTITNQLTIVNNIQNSNSNISEENEEDKEFWVPLSYIW